MAETSKEIALRSAELNYQLPDASALIAEGEDARDTAAFLVIVDEESLKTAVNEMNGMTSRVKALEKIRKSITSPMDVAKKNVMALFKPAIEGYQDGIATIKRAIGDYTLAQEKAAAEARAKAEALAAAERKALEQKAAEAESPEEAGAIQEAAAMVVAAPAPVATTKAKGMSTTKRLKGTVTDLVAFLRYVADHPELLGCVEVKAGALDRYIAATGGVVQIPGVTIKQEVIVSSRL